MNFILFCLSTIGMMSILTTSSLFTEYRNFIKKHMPYWACAASRCPQCVGTWTGFICGYILISTSPFVIFMCGCASSVLCQIYHYFQLYMLSIISAEVLLETFGDCEDEQPIESEDK